MSLRSKVAPVLCAVFLFCNTTLGRELEIRVSGDVDAQAEVEIRSAVQDILDRLPLGLTERFAVDGIVNFVVVEFSNEPSCDLSKRRFGKYVPRRNEILIDRSLLSLRAPEGTGNCDDWPKAQLLRATIAHEIGHLFDHISGFSSTSQFRYFIGGEKRFSKVRRHAVKNYSTNSPDPYEYRSASEAFAVNFEYYLLDPAFPCKRPAMTRLIDSAIGVESDKAACAAQSSLLVHSHFASENLAESVQINPSRVAEVHLLHAAEGKGIASRWGHSMLRLVICAPERPSVGPACVEDIDHHMVLSFRANVADVTINYLKGMYGAYPSQLFVYPLAEIIKEYTRIEFRDLESVPLNLSRQEIEVVVATTLERFWNYSGKYYFVTNHCGTETLNMLRAAGLDPERRLHARTPRRLLRTLNRSQLTDYSENRDSAFVHFASKRPEYNTAHETLRQFGFDAFPTLREHLDDSSPSDREAAYRNLFNSDGFANLSEAQKLKVVSSALLVERLATTRAHDRLTAARATRARRPASRRTR